MKAEEDDDDDDDDDQVCESGDRDCICVDYENEDGDDEEYCCSVRMAYTLFYDFSLNYIGWSIRLYTTF